MQIKKVVFKNYNSLVSTFKVMNKIIIYKYDRIDEKKPTYV